MLSRNKKKLRNILAKLSPEKEGKLLAQNLADDIKALEGKIPVIPNTTDYSNAIRTIYAELGTLRDTILSKLSDLPDRNSFDDIKKKYLEEITKVEQKFTLIVADIETDASDTDNEIEKLKKDIPKEVASLTELISKLRDEVRSRGGGNMNRQIKVDGVDVLKKYTDINLVAGTNIVLTPTVDETNKNVEIEIVAQNDATAVWGSITGTLSNQTDLQTALDAKQNSGNYITALTGDGTATGPGSVAITLATVNGNVGSFGSSTSIPSFTVNAKGLITAASGNAVVAPAGTLTGTTLAANVVTSSLTTIGTLVGGSVPFSLVTGLDADLATFSLPASTTISAFGATLVDDADASTARTTLGLVIGTNVQAYDADLTTWAGITPGANVATALAVNVGSAGAFLLNNGAGTSLTGIPYTISGTANQIAASAGTGNITLSLPSDVLIPTVLTVPNTGLHLLDTNASHDLIIKPGSDISADRTLTITTGDTDMIVNLTAVTDEYVLAYDTGTNTWRGVAPPASGLTIGTTAIASGTTTRILYDNAGTLGEYVISGSGNVAMTTNPVFTTPNLGTPSAATLTNATGLPEGGLSLTDVTTNNASTSNHGFLVKATAPAAGYNVPAIAFGETVYTNKNVREVLTADRTYYVRTDGSDSNTGLVNNAGGAFLTIQKAMDVSASLDQSIYAILISVADGTYTAGVTLKDPVGSGTLNLTGNTTTPTNCIINPTGAACVSSSGRTRVWTVAGFQLKTTTSGNGVSAANGSKITLGQMDYGTVSVGNYHITADVGSTIVITSGINYTISGGAYAHYGCQENSMILDVNKTITLSGSLAFTFFAYIAMASGIYSNSTYTGGTITGTKYSVDLNGWVNTLGGGVNMFPGDVAGGTSNGGQYS